MEVQKTAIAGTLESSDIMVTVEANNVGIEVALRSSVEKQYGQHIRKLIQMVLEENKVDHVRITAVDKGALDCTIRARVLTALSRASGTEEYKWGE